MSLRFHWFLPTNGDGRDIVGGGHGVATGAAGTIRPVAVEVHLRPLLVELGATVPALGLYVTEPEFADPSPVIGRWAEAAVPLLRRALG